MHSVVKSIHAVVWLKVNNAHSKNVICSSINTKKILFLSKEQLSLSINTIRNGKAHEKRQSEKDMGKGIKTDT